MKNTKLLIAGGGIILTLGIAVVLLMRNGAGRAHMPDSEFEAWGRPLDEAQNDVEEVFGIFDKEDVAYPELMKQVKEGRLNLVWEFWHMRRMCPRGLEYDGCNNMIRTYFDKKFAPPANQKLKELFDRFLAYEAAVRDAPLPSAADLRERYQAMLERRRQSMGADAEKLIFGVEEAKVQFDFAFNDFLKDSAGQRGDARVKAYDSMRRQYFGEYFAALDEMQPKYDKYSIEILLREWDLNQAVSGERASMLYNLRAGYFGKDGADRMARNDAELAREAETEDALRREETKFTEAHANFSAVDIERGLLEIRRRYLGSEEAAQAFARRMAFEKAEREQQ
ncbi:MAG: hypothetical protein HY042_10225 [Spirochaetia bacterium]|nr:hypothetical protein [Spirochaetia bacterium]